MQNRETTDSLSSARIGSWPRECSEQLSNFCELATEQQREDQVRKAIIGSLQNFFDTLKEAHDGRYTNDARAAFHNALTACEKNHGMRIFLRNGGAAAR